MRKNSPNPVNVGGQVVQTPEYVVGNLQTEPLPHRQPFKTAAARFNSLRQEWSFLIINNLWAMEEGTLKAWGQEVDEMANLLEQLANNPSPRNLTLTQNALKRFSYKFKSVMSRQKDLSAYQIQVSPTSSVWSSGGASR